MTENDASRRNVLAGLAATGVALPLLAACGSGSTSDATGTTGSAGGGAPAGGSNGVNNSNRKRSGGGGGIPTSEIPVGGGKIFAGSQIVVTQPSAGQFKAFSAICTHQGCTVGQVSGGKIICPCHFSEFSIEDGSVEGGPAPSPLPEMKVTVTGQTLTVST